ncbi:MAG: hypothetical protein ACOZAR_02595 [Patescibacteria group bacterium]
MEIIKPNQSIRPTPAFLVAISLVSATLLSLEIVLTRIFSVLYWYHYAFLAISICLTGASLAGLVLFLFPGLTKPEKLLSKLSFWSLLLGISIGLGLILIDYPAGPLSVFWLSLYFVVPFFFGSLILGLSFTKFSQQINYLYSADLVGAGFGCLLTVLIINLFGGPNSLLVLSLLAALASLMFLIGSHQDKLKPYFWPAIFAFCLLISIIKVYPDQIISLKSTKNSAPKSQLLYEGWNEFSQITAWKNHSQKSFYWSLSPVVPQPTAPDYLPLLIDANALTPLHHFSGDLSQFDWLKSDLPAFAYRLLPPAPQVYVIGAGGGHDVLTGLVAGASQVDGAEINSLIVDLVENKLSDFSGHLYDRSDVDIAVTDARSHLSNSDKKYDLIVASLIDTWAASAANAFALTENQLYTLEAFQQYLSHLNDQGILSFVRWYSPSQPAEIQRLASLSLSSLKQSGATDPRQHIAVVANFARTQSDQGLAVVLVQKKPYSATQLEQIRQLGQELQFPVLYLPGQNQDNPVSRFILDFDQKKSQNQYPYDLTPPTDDRPFFFNFFSLTQIFSHFSFWKDQNLTSPVISNLIIFCLIFISIGLLIILLPWFRSSLINRFNRSFLRSRIYYFAALGLGFMMTEVSLLGRLTIYLGHPIYALIFVLFVFLTLSGLGSRFSLFFTFKNRYLMPVAIISLIIINLLSCLFLFPITNLWPIQSKIMICLIQIAPLAFFLGMPYPVAIKQIPSPLIPWFFSINAIFGVLGSVLGTLIILQLGFGFGLIAATLSYLTIFVSSKTLSPN